MNALLGSLLFGIAVCGIIGAARWFLLFVSRMRGRKPLATYTRRWPVTRA